jgi:hypothetical protein
MRAGGVRIELVSERRARWYRTLGEMRHSVHVGRIHLVMPVPVNAGRLLHESIVQVHDHVIPHADLMEEIVD